MQMIIMIICEYINKMFDFTNVKGADVIFPFDHRRIHLAAQIFQKVSYSFLCENNIIFSIFNMYRSAFLLLNVFAFLETPHFLFTSLKGVKNYNKPYSDK